MDCYGAVCAVSASEYGGVATGCWHVRRLGIPEMAACWPVGWRRVALLEAACWPVTCNALRATNVRRLGRLCSAPYAFFVTSRGLS